MGRVSDPRASAGAVQTGAVPGRMQTPVTLYGIPNCDQVKQARQWLAAQQVDYSFHDFKKQGLSAALARRWLDAAGVERVINRKGTTWRGLDDARKALGDKASGVISLVTEHPSLVKRPVLDCNGSITIGFDSDHYASLFP